LLTALFAGVKKEKKMNYNEWAFHDIEPIYLQLVKKIECAILSTQLSAGEELPSIRVMAKLLKISPNTVMKAYMRLCQSGLIISSRNGHYSVIDNEQYILQAKDEKVQELCISYLSNMISLGFSKEEATNFLTEYSSKLKEPNK
jgi:GntR family transcriptional regulator